MLVLDEAVSELVMTTFLKELILEPLMAVVPLKVTVFVPVV
jgi:hypothetical protein